MFSLVPLFLLISPVLSSPFDNNSNSHSRRFHHRRQSPSSLSPGSLSTSEGCTAFYQVPVGEYCIGVAQKFGVSLDEFYSWNTEVSRGDCPDLLAGVSYCVKGPATTSSVPSVVTFAPSSSSATSTVPPRATTTSSTVTPTPTPFSSQAQAVAVAVPTSSASSATDDEEDGDCEIDDGEEETTVEAYTSTSAPVAVAVVPTTSTTPAPSTTPVPTTTAAPTTAAPTTTAAAVAQAAVVGTSALSKLGIKSLLGNLSGSLASWYNANSGTDSTNGHSWCGYPYSNDSPVFAPPIKLMMQDFGDDYEKAATAYCGAEAILTTPEGKSITLYIGDAFDMTWVRTEYAVDIMHDAFNTLFGSSTDNKNDVISGVTWKLTGNVNPQWKFKSTGSG